MKRLQWLSLGAMVFGASAWIAAGCSTSTAGRAGDGGGGTGGAGTTGTGGGGFDGPTFGTDGGGKIPLGQTECSDGIDNDGDGKIDGADPECTGPFDNSEASFATGIPGDNSDPCKQDCFFDGNSGQGDDGCDWNLKCDPASPGANAAHACPYDPNFHNCPTSQSQMCTNICQAITPNGCDCFGCCAIPGIDHPIYLAPTCTLADANDPVKCPPCTQQAACINPCDHCEICLGKTTLPADCTPGSDAGTPAPVCPPGYSTCGPTGVDPTACPVNTYCVTGCCLPNTLVP